MTLKLPPLDAVTADTALPHRTEVVVIGGGIIGVCTALFLAQRGIPVVLLEKGQVGAEQSGRNWGWCRVMGRDPREIPLGIESLRLWRGMNALTGVETGFRQAGVAYLADTPLQEADNEAWMEHARQYQLDTKLLGPDEVEHLLPGAGRRFAGALHTPSDGRAEPQRAAPAIAAAARRHGAVILTGCAARTIDLQGGRVAGVVTERGRVACNQVVLAGGAWSRLFLGNLGINFPQLKLLGSVLRTKPLKGAPEAAVGGADFAFRKRLDGGYTVARRNASIADLVPDSFRLLPSFLPALRKGRNELRFRVGRRFIEEARLARRWTAEEETPFEQVRVLDPEPSRRILDEGLVNLGRAFPAFKEAQVEQRWAGLIDATPDAVPVISPVDGLPGLVLAAGFSGHGFGIGPGAGRLVADLVAGSPPVVDPAPFRFSRFANAA